MKAFKIEEAKVKNSLNQAKTAISKHIEETEKLEQQTRQKQSEHSDIESELSQLSQLPVPTEDSKSRMLELQEKKRKIAEEKNEIDQELEANKNKLKELEILKQREEERLKALEKKLIDEEEGFVNDLSKVSDDIGDLADDLVVGVTSIQQALHNVNTLVDTLVNAEFRIPNLFVLVIYIFVSF